MGFQLQEQFLRDMVSWTEGLGNASCNLSLLEASNVWKQTTFLRSPAVQGPVELCVIPKPVLSTKDMSYSPPTRH